MDDHISSPPREVLDSLAALQTVADIRTRRRDASVLRKVLTTYGPDNGAGVDAVAKVTKSVSSSQPKPSSLLPQP
jgi:hypothetical protein